MKDVAGAGVHRVDAIEAYSLAPKFLEALTAQLAKDNRWSILFQDGTLSVSGDGFSESTELARVALAD